ncbi:hypothetical protein KC460_02570 [Candidatus Dependentiae bacterium]|nr:hypothetical protein [Candidatus Dependentiae bacterium]
MKKLMTVIFVFSVFSYTSSEANWRRILWGSAAEQIVSRAWSFTKITSCTSHLFDFATDAALTVCGFGYSYYSFDRSSKNEDDPYFKALGILAMLTAFKGSKGLLKSFVKLRKCYNGTGRATRKFTYKRVRRF